MFQWAFIGAGAIARTVAEEITANGHGIAAVYSRTPARAAELAQKCGASACKSLEELLHGGADAVYIATPHASHYPYLLACIGAGVPVLCEKAFTVNAEQAKRAANFARERGVLVMEGMWTRFLPLAKELRRIAAGEIGQIRSVEAEFSTGFSSSRAGRPLRLFRPEDAGGALLDIGCYCVSFCQMLFGRPDSVDCRMKFGGGIDTEEEIVLGYGGGLQCKIISSFERPRRVFAKIAGDGGTVSIPEFNAPETMLLCRGGAEEELRGSRGYRFEFEAFREDAQAGRKEDPGMPLGDTVCVMEVLDECRRQNKFYYPAEIEGV